ncbi:MAG: zinc-ribbon domain-containing protein [Clostridia bacterium]|nr:zinc-ribbon domain-containing protein [Clostridia bacterium]MBR0088693.1 zinc-ribbon domain-containing protein [Clostridia bacterium]
MMKKCLNCGNENADNELFCGECGMKLEEAAAMPEKADNNEYMPHTAYAQEQKPTPNKKFLILIIAVIILSIIVILLLFSQCKSNPQQVQNMATAIPIQTTSGPKAIQTASPTKKPQPTNTPKPTATPQPEPKEKEFIKENYGYVDYSELARNPDAYTGKSLTYKGKVIQVIEGDTETQHRIAVNGNYDKVIFVGYPKNMVASRVLEDDYVTVYGTSLGLYSYQSTMGGKITIPALYLDRIEIN